MYPAHHELESITSIIINIIVTVISYPYLSMLALA